MESNFIKERSVIREEIIKKNLEKANKESRQSKDLLSASLLETPNEKIIALEELINENLKSDLAKLSKKEDAISSTIADYLKIKSALKIIKSNTKRVKVQTNIGCDFYAQCIIEDASKVYICVGKDYYLQMGLDEAIEMISFKEKQLQQILDQYQEKASQIKAYIKIALETLGRFYELDKSTIQ